MTLKIFETRLVRVPFGKFHGVKDTEEWKMVVYSYRHRLREDFGPEWRSIGPAYEVNFVENCVEYQYQRVYEISE